MVSDAQFAIRMNHSLLQMSYWILYRLQTSLVELTADSKIAVVR